jgi:hypothetical protein
MSGYLINLPSIPEITEEADIIRQKAAKMVEEYLSMEITFLDIKCVSLVEKIKLSGVDLQ